MVREILFFAFVVLVLGLLWTVDHEKISKRLKIGVTIVALILGGAAWTYEKEVGEREAGRSGSGRAEGLDHPVVRLFAFEGVVGGACRLV